MSRCDKFPLGISYFILEGVGRQRLKGRKRLAFGNKRRNSGCICICTEAVLSLAASVSVFVFVKKRKRMVKGKQVEEIRVQTVLSRAVSRTVS